MSYDYQKYCSNENCRRPLINTDEVRDQLCTICLYKELNMDNFSNVCHCDPIYFCPHCGKKKIQVPKLEIKPIFVTYILDESGSMQSVISGTISGFNEYINNLKKNKVNDQDRISLITFNSMQNNNYRFRATQISNVSELNKENFHPNGWTPLFDAIFEGINSASTWDSHDKFVVIHTDGQENSSKTTSTVIKSLIEAKQREGWKFIFLGADQDAWVGAGNIGIPRQNTISYDHTNVDTARAFKAASIGTYSYSTSADRGAFTLSDAEIDLRDKS